MGSIQFPRITDRIRMSFGIQSDDFLYNYNFTYFMFSILCINNTIDIEKSLTDSNEKLLYDLLVISHTLMKKDCDDIITNENIIDSRPNQCELYIFPFFCFIFTSFLIIVSVFSLYFFIDLYIMAFQDLEGWGIFWIWTGFLFLSVFITYCHCIFKKLIKDKCYL